MSFLRIFQPIANVTKNKPAFYTALLAMYVASTFAQNITDVPTNSTNTNPMNPIDDGLSPGAIAGIAIGVTVGAAALITAAICCIKNCIDATCTSSLENPLCLALACFLCHQVCCNCSDRDRRQYETIFNRT